jgi:hypothetical protein
MTKCAWYHTGEIETPRARCERPGAGRTPELEVPDMTNNTGAVNPPTKPPIIRHDVLPLAELPAEAQDQIRRAVARPYPPAQWLHLGHPSRPQPIAVIPSRAWYEWHWQRGVDPDSRYIPLSARTRQLVIERDGYTCGLCGLDVAPDDVHIDHVLPRSRGGSDHPDNLQVAHSLCNVRKGNRTD